MKFRNLTLAALLLMPVATQAHAADATDGKSEGIAVEKMICQQLYVHKPADDVAFKPGVDVDGNPVAPADLPATGVAISVPDFIEVPLTVDLAQRLSQPVPEGVKMEGVIGNLRLYKDGRISYNGQDLLPQAEQLCGAPLKVDPAKVEARPVYNNVTPNAPQAGATALSTTELPYPTVIPDKAPLASKSANFTPKAE